MLRVVRLPEAQFEPAPVSLDTGHALDECLRRDGWIAFGANLDVWGLSTPFGDPPFLIRTNAVVACVGEDAHTVWLADGDRSDDAPSAVALFDGVTRKIVREIALPAGFDLVGETPSGFVLGRGYRGGLHLWAARRDAPERLLDGVSAYSVDSGGAHVFCWRPDSEEIVFFGLARRASVSVPQPEGARWELRTAAFSPDATRLAISIDYSSQLTANERSTRFAETVAGHGSYDPKPRRLGLLSTTSNAITIADGHYDNFAYPIWSIDGEWVVFSAPFQPRGLWVCRAAKARLERVRFSRDAPVPLCDVSDLFD